jgi:hypothetical protein
VSPWLPDWLPRLEVHGIRIGGGSLDVTVARQAGRTIIEQITAKDVEVVRDPPAAPLWGRPIV